MSDHLTVRIPKRTLQAGLIIAIVVAVMAPIAAHAMGGKFTDDDTSIFESNIEWLAGAGVTLGCNPPTNDQFCPNDSVSRGQMAAFMQRFAQYLGAEDGQVSKADDAETIDGLAPSAFLRNDVIEIAQASGWVPNAGTGTSVEYNVTADVLGGGGNQLGLITPTTVGIDTYYLDSVEVCYGGAFSGGTITASRVYRSTPSGSSGAIVDDNTSRTTVFPATECYQLSVADSTAPSGSTYHLFLNVTGDVNVASVTSSYRTH
ncbi:MAG: hypothetical protein WBV06_02000 [Acidimicrobiia bacterium]